MDAVANAVSDDLVAAGLDPEAVHEWIAAEPARTADITTDRHRYSAFWDRSTALIASLPAKAASATPAQADAASAFFAVARESRGTVPRGPCGGGL